MRNVCNTHRIVDNKMVENSAFKNVGVEENKDLELLKYLADIFITPTKKPPSP